MRTAKPPVLLVGNFLSASHASRGVCEELANRLRAAQWSVRTTSSRPDRLARLADMVTTVVRHRRDYAVAHVDVFSGQAFLWAEAACATLKWCGRPFALTLHGGGLPDFARRNSRSVRRLLQSARVVTTPSGFLRQELAPYREDLLRLPNAIDLSLYRYRERPRLAPALVWLRAFHEIYNPVLAPHVVKLLLPEFPDVRLTMIGADKGDGSRQRTQRVAAELGVADRITFPGKIAKSSVPTWLSCSDIFLNTTDVDNMPVSVVEALACGLPVVSTNVGGLPHLVEHGTNALLVPPRNAEAMAAAVRRILREPELARTLTQNGRGLAARHDWSVVLPEWEALLASLAN